MPPGMLQQMQRQMRGGGMQEMMKAMMRGQGGDQFDMEEMQRKLLAPNFSPSLLPLLVYREANGHLSA